MNKGQINFEFMLSVLVFLSITGFLTIQIINNVSAMRRALLLEDMKSSAYQISNILVFDKGYPEDWDENSVERIGLASGFYNLSDEKISSLKRLCESENGYKKFLSVIGLGISKDVYLNISTNLGDTLALCAPPVVSTIRSTVHISRTSFAEGSGVVKIDLRVIL
ncbi:MAG: hypothetical protein QMD85_04460 [Candidatus Aenigmarchaeota archaeon]|nr:hypothetical protein [Candidatus Aenigmarchaeota archaeon]MDI6722826.1 hypothetical protein [Candidatus Aenigmarchaeota archaeon]